MTSESERRVNTVEERRVNTVVCISRLRRGSMRISMIK
jgi:hypothetical protein